MSERLNRLKAGTMAGGILAGALMLASCASGVNGEVHGGADKQPVANTPTTEASNSDTMYDIEAKGLNEFRKGAQDNHVVRALMGVCMGWPNATSGMTVTLNPGVAAYTAGDKSLAMVVFSATEYDTTPPKVVFMNGPGVLYGGTGEDKKILIDDIDNPAISSIISIDGAAEPQRISDIPIQLANGDWSYVNEVTGVPVAETRLIDQPYSASAVKQACNDLRTSQVVELEPFI